MQRDLSADSSLPRGDWVAAVPGRGRGCEQSQGGAELAFEDKKDQHSWNVVSDAEVAGAVARLGQSRATWEVSCTPRAGRNCLQGIFCCLGSMG